MKSPKMILGALMLIMSAHAFSQTDTTSKDKKDTTKTFSIVATNQSSLAFDTIPKKDTSTKDTTKMFAYGYAVLDTVPKDTTKKDSLNFVAKGPFVSADDYLILDTIPKDTATKKDTTKWISSGYAVLDTVPKDTTKKDSVNLLARGPYAFESNNLVLDTVPADTTKKPSGNGWGSLAPLPQTAEITEFKSSAPAPNAGKYYVPVLGAYQPEAQTTATDQNAGAATTSASGVTITVDDQNPGKIWVDGVGDTKFYAYLKTTDNVYKIPAQKVEDKKVEEGIVTYNEATKEVHIRIGSGFNDADPNASLNATQAVASAETETATEKSVKKGKHVAHTTTKKEIKKVISFDGNKTETGTAAL